MKIEKNNKIWIKVSNSCNNKCIFCLDADNQNGSFVKPNDFKNYIDQVLINDTEKVILSGGEVTLHPDLFAMIEYLKQKKCRKIQIITNGRLLCYKDYCDRLIKSGVDEVTFSIHGHKEEIHDKLTGIKGSFQQTISGLKNVLKNKDIIVNIDIVLNGINYKYLSSIILYFIKLGVYEFDILNLVPFGRAFENRQDLFLSKAEVIKTLEKVNKIAKSKKLHIWLNRFPADISLKFKNLISNYKKIYDEVLSKEKEFEDLAIWGRKMNCADIDRCSLCFLNDFCQKFNYTLNQCYGEQKKQEEKVVKQCYNNMIDMEKDSNSNLHYKDVKIIKILDYYYTYLFRVKLGKCFYCELEKSCLGYPVKLIKN